MCDVRGSPWYCSRYRRQGFCESNRPANEQRPDARPPRRTESCGAHSKCPRKGLPPGKTYHPRRRRQSRHSRIRGRSDCRPQAKVVTACQLKSTSSPKSLKCLSFQQDRDTILDRSLESAPSRWLYAENSLSRTPSHYASFASDSFDSTLPLA